MSRKLCLLWTFAHLLLAHSESFLPHQPGLHIAFELCNDAAAARLCLIDCSFPISDDVDNTARELWTSQFRAHWPEHVEELPEMSDDLLRTTELIKDELVTDSIDYSADFVRVFDECMGASKQYIERRKALNKTVRKDPLYWLEFMEVSITLRRKILKERFILTEKTRLLVGALVRRWYATDVLRRIKSGMGDGCDRVKWQYLPYRSMRSSNQKRVDFNARDEDICVYPPTSTEIHVL